MGRVDSVRALALMFIVSDFLQQGDIDIGLVGFGSGPGAEDFA